VAGLLRVVVLGQSVDRNRNPVPSQPIHSIGMGMIPLVTTMVKYSGGSVRAECG
jgi:hypothetical protein